MAKGFISHTCHLKWLNDHVHLRKHRTPLQVRGDGYSDILQDRLEEAV